MLFRSKERQGQAGTSQNPKPKTNPARKQAIKVGKGKDKVIVQSGSDEDTATVTTSETTESLGRKSRRGSKGKAGLGQGEVQEPRPKTPSGFHEYPNPIKEKENLVKAKALVEECQTTREEPRAQVDICYASNIGLHTCNIYI